MALSTTQYGYIIDPMVPFTDDKGKTIKNGFVRIFVAGSSTPVVTYRNFDGAANQDLIELDNSGRTKTSVIGSKGITYKVCVYDKHHSQESPILTVDKVSVIGANITAGAGATVVTGLDGLTTKPDGFVDASVVGTDGYVALDHTLVTDDLNTDAKVTAVENDRYIPLLNEDVNDPDSKMTLGRLWKWALGKINSLSTTITAFRTGDVIPVDGPDGTAKMSKDDLLKETADNALGSIKSLSNMATEGDLISNTYFALDGEAGSKKLPANIIPACKIIDRGSANVATLNDLTFKQDGWKYLVSNSGTLTAGSLIVEKNDNVYWDASNSVWKKLNQYVSIPKGALLTSKLFSLKTENNLIEYKNYDNAVLYDIQGNVNIGISESLKNGTIVNVDDLGAVGDGIADDSEAISQAISDSTIINFTAGKTYKITKNIKVTSKKGFCIQGNGATLLVGDEWDSSIVSTLNNCVLYFGGCSSFKISNLTITRGNGSNATNISILYGCSNFVLSNLVFTTPSNSKKFTPLDMYQSNINGCILSCKFDEITHTTSGLSGGVWVRNFYDGTTKNIYFINCDFINEQTDEVLAIFSASSTITTLSTIKNIVIEGCRFVANSWGDDSVKADKLITIGLNESAKSVFEDIRLNNCSFVCNGGIVSSIIQNSGSSVIPLVENSNFEVTANISQIIRGKIKVRNSAITSTGTAYISYSANIFEFCDIKANGNQTFYYGAVLKNCRVETPKNLCYDGITCTNCELVLIGNGTLKNFFVGSSANRPMVIKGCKISSYSTLYISTSNCESKSEISDCYFSDVVKIQWVGSTHITDELKNNIFADRSTTFTLSNGVSSTGNIVGNIFE